MSRRPHRSVTARRVACCVGVIMQAGLAYTHAADTAVPPPQGTLPAEPVESNAAPWRIPPIRWGATTSTEARLLQAADERPRLQQLENITFRAASHIYQPWLAQLGGTLGFLTARERGGGSAENEPAPKTSSASVTGGGTLALFPVSRFPLNAYFDRSDSRASGELVRNDTVTTRFGVRQSYAPLDGQSSYSASYDRSTLASRAFGDDTVNAFALNANRVLGAHTVDLAGGYTTNTRSNTGESTRLARAHGRHRYTADGLYSVESFASFTTSDFHLVSGGMPQDNRSRFLQGSLLGTWRPAEDSPLFVTGGARFFDSTVEFNGLANEARTVNANVAATYALTPNTTVAASALVTQAISGSSSELLTAQNASVAHVGSPLGFAGFLYTWNASLSAGNQTASLAGTRQNVGGQLAHNLTREFAVNDTSALVASLGQSLAGNFDTVTSQSTTLSHNANVTWRLMPAARTTGFLSVLGADSRTFGHNANAFQLFNAQATGQIQFDRYAFAAANLTVQAAQHSRALEPAAGFSWMRSGSITYQHARAFDVPRLRYFASYYVNSAQPALRLQGDVNGSREQVSQSLEQRLDYNIGRIELRLSARIAVIDGRRNTLVFLRMGRQFGQF